MKRLFLATLSLSAALAAFACTSGRPPATYHSGPYDNTGRGPWQTGLEGGGG